MKVQNLTGAATLGVVPGKVNVLVFWATWSMPDIYLLRKLQPIWKKLEDRGLVITAVSVDDESKGVLDVARAQGATYAVGWDENRETALRYHPTTDPYLFIIDRKGVIRFRHEGFHDGEDLEIEREIESLL